MNVLIDTSVWSLVYRRKALDYNQQQRRITESVGAIISEGRAKLLGMVRQELLSGLREPAQFERLRRILQEFPDIALTQDDHVEAARMCNLCRAKGIAESHIDYLICAVASRRDWFILTLDRDFDQYAHHLPIKLLKDVSAT